MMNKEGLRKEMTERRFLLSKFQVQDLSHNLFKLFLKSDLSGYKNYMAYLPIRREADTKELIDFLLDNGKNVFVPHINSSKKLVAVRLQSDSVFEREDFGIKIPKDKIEIDPTLLDVIFVPGLAFDKEGHRVGYGKGYYDAFLKDLQCITCAWCYDFQIVSKIDGITKHDIPIKRFL